MEYMGYFLISIVGLYILIKLFKWPLKMLYKLIINGFIGIILLITVNFIGAIYNFYLGINILNVLIAGFLGIPGVIFLIIFKIFL